jgi:hypothetical protein
MYGEYGVHTSSALNAYLLRVVILLVKIHVEQSHWIGPPGDLMQPVWARGWDLITFKR